MIWHKEALLQNIAAGLNANIDHKIASLKVTFHCENGTYDFGVAEAIDAIGNDLFWDERGDWSNATHATVEVF